MQKKQNREYLLSSGASVPRVTSIIGRYKDSGALMHWAFEQGKRAQRGEIQSLYDERDAAANSGTEAHRLIEAHLKGQETSSEDEQAMNALEQAKRWLAETGISIVCTEKMLVSERHRFGGTPDAIGLLRGNLVLLDWKASNGIYADYLLQLAAYGILWDENNEIPISEYRICRFSKTRGDFSVLALDDLSKEREYFLLLRQAYDYDKAMKKRAA